eukprot:5849170-Pyramimonas_sp.AAC.1
MSSIAALPAHGCFLRSASRGGHSAAAAKALTTASCKLSRDWHWHNAGIQLAKISANKCWPAALASAD